MGLNVMDEIAEAARAWADENYRHQRVAACDGFEAGAKWALERAARAAELPFPVEDKILCGDTCDHVAALIRSLLPAPAAKDPR
jgi:hypothetical protein